MLSPNTMHTASSPMNFSPMMKACASPSGEGCSAYSNFTPKSLPSPNKRWNPGKSCGVVPHKVTFKECDFYGVKCFNKEVTIAKIGKPPLSSKILLSDNLFQEIKSEIIDCYSLYIESDNLGGIIKLADDQGYIINSVIVESAQSTMKSIELFKGVFDLITSIILLICIIIITSFGIKSVRSKIYEIGVMKSLGCKLSKFIVMFGMHTLFIALVSIVLFVFCYGVLSINANEILLDSLRNIGQAKFLGNIKIISFEWKYVLINSITILTISLISTIIPFLLLIKIKPIKIINSKE